MKAYKLKKDDKVAIVSLSSGVLGEHFIGHEIGIGIKRLEKMGLSPVIMPNALKGIEYLKEHPEKRAEDLKMAFMDSDIKMIITAIGGDDTYRTLPYLMEDKEFLTAVKNKPKIFTGFSDTTINHFMFNKIGLSTFYGPAFLVDLCELDNEMLPYTEKYFSLYFNEEYEFEIEPSPVWYLDRTDYSKNAIGTSRIEVIEQNGFEILNGNGVKIGKLYGGCIDSIYDMLTGNRYGDEDEIFNRYNLLPTLEEFKEKILFLETSEEKMTPNNLEDALLELKKRGILSSVQGVIVGKPYDEVFYEEYKDVYKKVFEDLDTPVLYNVNFGHAYPRCVLPYDSLTTVDFDNKKINVKLNLVNKKEESYTKCLKK